MNPDTGEEHPHEAKADAPATETPDPAALEAIAKWTKKQNAGKLPLPDEQRAKYHADLSSVLAKLPAGCVKAVSEVMGEFASALTFHPDVASVTAACAKASGKRESKVGGFVEHRAGDEECRVHLDGDNETDSAKDIYAHELGHVVDVGHRFSDSKTWQTLFKTEIKSNKDKHFLSRYAILSPAEAFAEFHAMLYKVGVESAKMKWPKCVQFFEKNGLL